MRYSKMPSRIGVLFVATILGAGCAPGASGPGEVISSRTIPADERLTPLMPDGVTSFPAFTSFPGITSPSGFYGPLPSIPNYDCTYGSSGGATYTTLWADNEDGGYAARRASMHDGSSCDSYDDISGRPYQGEFCGAHPGVDIAVSTGTPIYAIWWGTVEHVDATLSESFGWGKYIVLNVPISGGSIHVVYAHLSSVDSSVTTGAWVTAGQELGKTGNTGHSTGPHLHFQIDRDSAGTHPYWPAGGANKPDRSGSTAWYTFNPLYAIGFGTCY